MTAQHAIINKSFVSVDTFALASELLEKLHHVVVTALR